MKHTVEEIRLKNGARGLLIDVPDATVMSFQVQFRAGNRYVLNKDIYETAHIMEHMAFGANEKFRSEHNYEQEFTKNGAYHNAYTSDYSMVYEAICADFEWDRILDLKRVAITSPKFNDAELKSEKGNVRAELTGYMNDYGRLLWPRLQKAIGENVLNLRERLSTINNITLDDINEHYRRTHTANNMRFIIAGQTKHRKKEIIRNLESWELSPGERFEIPVDELHSSNAVLIKRKDASNITFGFSMITPRRLSTEETQAMGALNHLLNGTMSSRIFGQARRRGLVYGMGSGINSTNHYSSWDFDGEVNLETSEELFTLIQLEMIKALNGEISDTDIEAVKTYALGRYQMGAQTVSQISDYYTDDYFMTEKVEFYDNFPNIIKQISKPLIVELAREFAGSGIHAMVAVGSVEKQIINQLANCLVF